jgi:hypothetical protein
LSWRYHSNARNSETLEAAVTALGDAERARAQRNHLNPKSTKQNPRRSEADAGKKGST